MRIVHLLLVVLIVLTAVPPALSQEVPTAADSGRVVAFPPVVVTGDRMIDDGNTSAAPINTIRPDGSPLESFRSAATLLSFGTGMFIKDYGGASQLKSIATRGMGPEHTVVLLNGMRVNSSVNALADLSVLPLDNIGLIQAIRGGQSARYGADAVAGTVNLISSGPPEAANVRFTGGAGSFGRTSAEASVDIPARWGYAHAGAATGHADDNYPFDFTSYIGGANVTSTVNRRNADYTDHRADVRLVAPFGQSTASVTAFYFSSVRGGAGVFTGDGFLSAARQNDENTVIQGKVESAAGIRDRIEFDVQVQRQSQRYLDTTLKVGGQVLDAGYADLEYRSVSQYERYLTPASRLSAGLDIGISEASGTAFSRFAVRGQMAPFLGFAVLIPARALGLTGIVVNVNGRADITRNQIPAFTEQAGVVGRFGDQFNESADTVFPFALRFSEGTSFRLPTFNELYYAGGGGIGNPALQPERSFSIDAGIDAAFRFWGRHRVSIDAYRITMDDRIVWVAAGGINVTPVNLRSVSSTGVEAGYDWSAPNDRARLRAAWSNGRAIRESADWPGDPAAGNLLPLVPQTTGSVSGEVRSPAESGIIRCLSMFAAWRTVSFRYTNEANTLFLPSYDLTDLGAALDLAIGAAFLKAQWRVDNLFDEHYSVMNGYPMPGRSLAVNTSIQFIL